MRRRRRRRGGGRGEREGEGKIDDDYGEKILHEYFYS